MAINNPRLKVQRWQLGAGWLVRLVGWQAPGSMRNLVTITMAEAIKEGICYPFGASAYIHTYSTHTMHTYKCKKKKDKDQLQ